MLTDVEGAKKLLENVFDEHEDLWGKLPFTLMRILGLRFAVAP